MTKYSVNVILHNASLSDYKALKLAMENAGFVCLNKLPAGNKGHFLHITSFTWQGSMDLQELREFAFRILNASGKEFSFTVMKDKSVPVLHNGHYRERLFLKAKI
jgi:hypothetical protein